MHIQCKSCSKIYNIGDSLIPESGRKVRCSKCHHIWVQLPIDNEEGDYEDHDEREVAHNTTESEHHDENLDENQNSPNIDQLNNNFHIQNTNNYDDKIENEVHLSPSEIENIYKNHPINTNHSKTIHKKNVSDNPKKNPEAIHAYQKSKENQKEIPTQEKISTPLQEKPFKINSSNNFIDDIYTFEKNDIHNNNNSQYNELDEIEDLDNFDSQIDSKNYEIYNDEFEIAKKNKAHSKIFFLNRFFIALLIIAALLFTTGLLFYKVLPDNLQKIYQYLKLFKKPEENHIVLENSYAKLSRNKIKINGTFINNSTKNYPFPNLTVILLDKNNREQYTFKVSNKNNIIKGNEVYNFEFDEQLPTGIDISLTKKIWLHNKGGIFGNN